MSEATSGNPAESTRSEAWGSHRVDVAPSELVLPLCVAFEEPEELRGLDRSTALGARSTALGARSTALGAALTALGAELTAPRDESTAPPSGGASALLRPSVLWASAVPDSARTNAAAVVIVLMQFIRLDLLLAAHHDNPAHPRAFPVAFAIRNTKTWMPTTSAGHDENSAQEKLVPRKGLEPPTPALRKRCSTS
jgi:hypothetical protein